MNEQYGSNGATQFAFLNKLTEHTSKEFPDKLLGHISISTTQIYAKVLEKKIAEDMEQLRSKL